MIWNKIANNNWLEIPAKNQNLKEETLNVDKELKQAENTQIVEYKKPIIKRIFNRILKFIHLK